MRFETAQEQDCIDEPSHIKTEHFIGSGGTKPAIEASRPSGRSTGECGVR